MANPSEDYLLSCDWGTSSFRLRLLSLRSGNVQAEVTADQGISAVYRRWKREPDCSRLSFYRNILLNYLNILSEKSAVSLSGVPLVMSGMASSTLGIQELPYATLPFPLDGSGAVGMILEASADFPHDLLLISGLRNRSDVMRGEETQLLGLASPDEMFATGESIILFPGTHSKHVRVRDGVLVDFETYMTGEVFQLLSRQSILNESLEEPDKLNNADGLAMNPEAIEAFRQGLSHSAGANLLHAIFSTRTDHLFGKRDKAGNFYFLSGLLIGSELNPLKENKAAAIVLCGGANISPLYELALHQPGMPENRIIIPPATADLSAMRGHVVLAKASGLV